MLSRTGRLAWWFILILNVTQLVSFSINGAEAKWQVWLSGFAVLFALTLLRRDAIAEEREQRLAKLDVKR